MDNQTEVVEQLPTQNTTEKFGVDLANTPEIAELFASDKLDTIEELEANPLNIATQYYDFEQNKPARFAFLGITEHPANGGEMLPAVVLIDKDKNTYINMGAILVSTFIQNQITIGELVEINWIGTKKTQNGFTARTWSVRPLKSAK